MLPKCVFATASFANLILLVIKLLQIFLCEGGEAWYVTTMCVAALAAANACTHACVGVFHGHLTDHVTVYVIFKLLAVALLLLELANTCLTIQSPCWTSLAEVVSFSACVLGARVLCHSQWRLLLSLVPGSWCRSCFPTPIPRANPARGCSCHGDVPSIVVTQH